MGRMSEIHAAMYPNGFPGYQNETTSKAAASHVAARAETLRDAVLAALRQKEMTADQVAIHLDASAFSVRPRVTELFKMGKIENTGRTWPNESGRDAIVWAAKK